MSGQATTTELAAQAEDAIRALTHRTRRHTGGLTDPADTAGLIASLAQLTGMLPQLLDQLDDWYDRQHHTGHVRVDTDTLDTA